jgi:hypothetical protein
MGEGGAWVFTDEQKQRLRQWSNVYGWTAEQCETAAREDETLQRLLAFEMRTDAMPDEARAIRERITGIEVCHRQCKRNVEGILKMIGEMKPAHVYGCGEADTQLAAELRGTMAASAAWVDGRTEDAGSLVDVLGEQTPAKQWLVACLCKTLTKQLEHYQGDEPFAQPHWPAG